MPELLFLAPDEQPAATLADALCREVDRQDAAARLVRELPPPRADRVYLVVEGYAEPAATLSPDPARTIHVLLASPQEEGFAAAAARARSAGAAFHVNFAAVEALHGLGVPARHLQLGHAEGCQAGGGRRGELQILRGRYFDWPRALLAMHGGGVVLHEQALGMAPLVAGRQLFVASAESLDAVAEALREDPERLARTGEEALGFLRTALPLSLAAAALLGAARTLVAQPLSTGTVGTPGQTTPSSK